MSSSDPLRASVGHAFTVVGYKTPEQAEAWFRGERGLFDEVEAWLADNLSGRFRAEREPFPGVYEIEIDDDCDAVFFKLKWDDHLASPDDPPWLV